MDSSKEFTDVSLADMEAGRGEKYASTTGTEEDQQPKTNPEMGLNPEEVEKAREKYGWNEVPKHEVATWIIFLRQFTGTC